MDFNVSCGYAPLSWYHFPLLSTMSEYGVPHLPCGSGQLATITSCAFFASSVINDEYFPLSRQLEKFVTSKLISVAICGSKARSSPLLDGVISNNLSMYAQNASLPTCS